MESQFIREKLSENIHFTGIKDEKFKSNRISVNLIVPLQEDTVTEYALLPMLLGKGSRNMADFTELNRRLAGMYGATLSTGTSKLGPYQILTLSVSVMDDRFTMEKEQNTSRGAQLLCELLLQPRIASGKFDEELVRLERQALIEEIQAQMNDKRAYTIRRCEELLYQGQNRGLPQYGYKEKADQITAESATAAYNRLLSSCKMEIMFLGCGDMTNVCATFRNEFASVSTNGFSLDESGASLQNGEVLHGQEGLDVSQSKLAIGFQTPVSGPDKDAPATRLAVALFGGTPFSRLFVYVREKQSLCYYCAAKYDRMNGTMMIDCGIEADKKQQAYDEILRQFEIVKNGEFTPEELDNTRLSLINSLNGVKDSLSSQEAWYLAQIISGTLHSPSEEARKIAEVTVQDVQKAFEEMRLTADFFLTPKQ